MRQTLFKMTAIGVGTTIMGFCSWGWGGIKTGLNSKYNKEKGEFIPKEEGGGQVSEWTVTKETSGVKRAFW